MKDMDLVVQFATLWGMEIGSALNPAELKRVAEMKNYDSEELLTLFVNWKDEYLKRKVYARLTPNRRGMRLPCLQELFARVYSPSF